MKIDCPNCGKWIDAATQACEERNAMRDKLVLCQSRNDKLAHALEFLMDMQNGPPLITWEEPWNEAMKEAREALASYSEPHTKP